MLGLADRTRIIDLFEATMRGDIAAALKELREQYDAGADPAVILADLAEFTHFVTRVKIVPTVADDRSLAEAERTRGRAFASSLSLRVLARSWQLLLRGLPEVQTAAKPIAAAEMVLVRLAYAADLPTPDEVIRSLTEDTSPAGGRSQSDGGASAGPSTALTRSEPTRGAPRAALAHSPSVRTEPVATQDQGQVLTVARFEDLIALAAQKRDLPVKTALERNVRLVRFEDGRLEIALEPDASRALVNDLSRKLAQWTGRRWMVIVSAEQGQATVQSQNDARRADLERGARSDPLVQAVLARFPGAEIVGVRQRPPGGGDETLPPEPLDDADLPAADPDEQPDED